MRNDMLLIKTYRSSVGGNAISLETFTVERFIEEYNDKVFGWDSPDIRYCPVNGKGGYLIRDLEVHQFEDIFGDKIKFEIMGTLLCYFPEEHSIKSKYPFFRKAVYEKHGVKCKKTFDQETREYLAEVL